MHVQKLLKPLRKIGENNNIQCYNCSHEKPCGEKNKKQTLSYIDIASLKYIMRKLLKAKPTYEEEYNVMLSCQMTL
jgi:hypothetical protein